jgi:putative glutamine amidotransferase
MSNVKIPLIGISLDYETSKTYANYPWYALRENYITAITSKNAHCILLPYDLDAVDHYLQIIDGIVITGGNFDVDPSYYGADRNKHTMPKDNRTKFEFAITKKAIKMNMPLLGICGGEQLLNVVMNGTLIQHIPDEVSNHLIHEQSEAKHILTHSIKINPKSKFANIVGAENMMVNSTHHQAVKEIGQDLIICANAPDGVIEAIEHEYNDFCIGVQWHPEYESSTQDKALFSAFITASNQYLNGK